VVFLILGNQDTLQQKSMRHSYRRKITHAMALHKFVLAQLMRLRRPMWGKATPCRSTFFFNSGAMPVVRAWPQIFGQRPHQGQSPGL